jgi:hypothetical protein
MRTLSKIGLAGLRIGFVSAAPAIVKELEKLRMPFFLGPQPARQCRTHQRLAGRALRRSAGRARAPGDRARRDRQHQGVPQRGQPPAGAHRQQPRRPGDRGLPGARRARVLRNFDRPGPLAGCVHHAGHAAENDLLLHERRRRSSNSVVVAGAAAAMIAVRWIAIVLLFAACSVRPPAALK